MKSQYRIWDVVYVWIKSFGFDEIPAEREIMSKRKLGLFGYYYLTRVSVRTFYCGYIGSERRTKKIRESDIEYIIKNKNDEIKKGSKTCESTEWK